MEPRPTRDPSEMKTSPRGAIQTWSSMRERTFRLVLVISRPISNRAT